MTFVNLLLSGAPPEDVAAAWVAEPYWKSISAAKAFNARDCKCCKCEYVCRCDFSPDENPEETTACVCHCLESTYPKDFKIDQDTLFKIITYLKDQGIALDSTDLAYDGSELDAFIISLYNLSLDDLSKGAKAQKLSNYSLTYNMVRAASGWPRLSYTD